MFYSKPQEMQVLSLSDLTSPASTMQLLVVTLIGSYRKQLVY